MLALSPQILFNPFEDLPDFPASASGIDLCNSIEEIRLARRAAYGRGAI
jgi:hypothetical protein